MKQTIYSDKAPKPIGAYSQAVKSMGFLFTSGQIALDPQTGQLIQSNFEAESKQALENLRHVLEAADLSMQDVVKINVYLTDIGNFETFNTVYSSYFGASYPARTLVEVAKLPKGARVEVDAVATTNA